MKGLARVSLFAFALGLTPFAWSQNQAATSFLNQAAEINAAEIEMAEVAESRASNDSVKHYAKQIKGTHEVAKESLESIAQKQNVELKDEPSKAHQQEKERLSELEGQAFDKAYLDAQVKAHQQAIKTFQQQAKSAQNPDARLYAQMQLPSLRAHLEQAQMLQKHVAQGGQQKGMSQQQQRSPQQQGQSQQR